MNFLMGFFAAAFLVFVGFLFGVAGVYNLITRRKYFFWSGKKYIVLEEQNG